MIPISWYLIVAAALFCVGLFGVLSRKNAIAVLMGVELMLNAANINLLAFWRYWGVGDLRSVGAPVFVIIIFATAAAEVAVGLALIISVYRRRATIAADEIDLMKG